MTRRLIAAAAVLVSAYVHLHLWLDGMRHLNVVGPAFMVNAVAGVVIAALLVTWKSWIAPLLACRLRPVHPGRVHDRHHEPGPVRGPREVAGQLRLGGRGRRARRPRRWASPPSSRSVVRRRARPRPPPPRRPGPTAR